MSLETLVIKIDGTKININTKDLIIELTNM